MERTITFGDMNDATSEKIISDIGDWSMGEYPYISDESCRAILEHYAEKVVPHINPRQAISFDSIVSASKGDYVSAATLIRELVFMTDSGFESILKSGEQGLWAVIATTAYKALQQADADDS